MSDQKSNDERRRVKMSEDEYSDDEAERRVKDALRRALNTPAQHKPAKAPKAKPPAAKGRAKPRP